MEIKKDKFTKEFSQIYFKHKQSELIKSTPQIIEEIMQEKAKKKLEEMEVEDFLMDEIIENRKNTFTETDVIPNTKGKKDFKAEYKKFFIEFPKIYPTSTNIRFNDLHRDAKKQNNKSNLRIDCFLDKSKVMKGLRSNDQIHRCKLFIKQK